MRFAVVSSWCLSVSAWSDCCGDIDGNLLVQFASQGMQTRQALNSTTLPELPLLRKEVVSPLLGTSSLISRIALCTTAFSLVILSVSLALRGLPQKTPRNRAADGFPPRMFSFYWAVVAGVYFSADVYVPSMPQMEIDLDGSESMVSGSVQINLFAKAAGCFITGPLSDRVGRRPVLVLCLGLITVASLCCMCATSIWWFLLARILQGLGEAVEPVVFASVRDFHDDLKERYSVFSRLWIGTWAGPLAAPLVGGVIANSTSWRVDFLVLSLLWASLLILACAAVPESAPKEDRNSFWHDLGTVLENWRQDCLLIAEGFFYSIYFCFLANVSYVMEVYYGQSTLTTCAVIAATIFICTAWSLVMNYFYSKATFSVIHVAQCGVLAMIVPILVDVVAGISFSNSMWGYVLQSAFHMGLMTGPVTSLPTLFMDPLENVAGLAACMEVVFSGFLCSLASFGSTKCLIEFGEAGALLFHAFIAMIAVLIFWLGQGIWRHSDAKAYVMLASSP